MTEKNKVLSLLEKEHTEVVLTMGAGDIAGLAEGIINILKIKN